MEIIRKDYPLFDHLIDQHYYDRNSSQIKGFYSTKSNWRSAPKNSFILSYTVSYRADNQENNDYFVSYLKQLKLQCKIDNIDDDVEEVITIKEEMNYSLGLFLKEKSFHFYDLLKFEHIAYTEYEKSREKQSVLRSSSQKGFEKMTDEEKEMEIIHHQMPMIIQVQE